MSRCISRRSGGYESSFKLINGTNTRYSIFIEYRCHNEVLSGEICIECSRKLPMYKFQNNPKCDHGIIGGPYPPDSKLYGSPYYLNKVKRGWTALDTDEKRAKEAIQKAVSGMPNTKDVSEAENAPKKVFRLKSSASASVKSDSIKTTEVEKLKKPRKPRVKSIIPSISTIAEVSNQDTEMKMMETTDTPITVVDIMVVKVKKIRHQNKDYYFDSNSGKLYHALDTGVGAYKGRYSPEIKNVNTSIPDSDDEC